MSIPTRARAGHAAPTASAGTALARAPRRPVVARRVAARHRAQDRLAAAQRPLAVGPHPAAEAAKISDRTENDTPVRSLPPARPPGGTGPARPPHRAGR